MYFSCAIMLGQIALITIGLAIDPVGLFNPTPEGAICLSKYFCDINVHLKYINCQFSMFCTNDAFSDFYVACTLIILLIYICLSKKKPFQAYVVCCYIRP